MLHGLLTSCNRNSIGHCILIPQRSAIITITRSTNTNNTNNSIANPSLQSMEGNTTTTTYINIEELVVASSVFNNTY